MPSMFCEQSVPDAPYRRRLDAPKSPLRVGRLTGLRVKVEQMRRR